MYAAFVYHSLLSYNGYACSSVLLMLLDCCCHCWIVVGLLLLNLYQCSVTHHLNNVQWLVPLPRTTLHAPQVYTLGWCEEFGTKFVKFFKPTIFCTTKLSLANKKCDGRYIHVYKIYLRSFSTKGFMRNIMFLHRCAWLARDTIGCHWSLVRENSSCKMVWRLYNFSYIFSQDYIITSYLLYWGSLSTLFVVAACGNVYIATRN